MKQEFGLQLPVVDASQFFQARSQGREASAEARELGFNIVEACRSAGMFYLTGHNIEQHLIDGVLEETASFFALDQETKNRLNIKNSSHFRGYGLLKNYRDWREQIHIGPDSPMHAEICHQPQARYWQLWGENQWPERVNFKKTMRDYFTAVESLARTILTIMAEQMDCKSDFFTARMMNRPYLLMKAMSYLPQETDQNKLPHSQSQSGVTAHCDWSWLTFLIQDEVGGLEAQDAAGLWRRVIPLPGSIIVNTGELLELEANLHASAHRVINSRIDRQRFSIPVFINPALDAVILPAVPNHNVETADCRHVHKVIKPGKEVSPFIFGDSEFERKVLGKWCFEDECTNYKI